LKGNGTMKYSEEYFLQKWFWKCWPMFRYWGRR